MNGICDQIKRTLRSQAITGRPGFKVSGVSLKIYKIKMFYFVAGRCNFDYLLSQNVNTSPCKNMLFFYRSLNPQLAVDETSRMKSAVVLQ